MNKKELINHMMRITKGEIETALEASEASEAAIENAAQWAGVTGYQSGRAVDARAAATRAAYRASVKRDNAIEWMEETAARLRKLNK